jgi:hypothetical protein
MERNYYIVNVDDKNYRAILALSTNAVTEKPRCSLDETKAVLEMRSFVNLPPFMDDYTPLTQEESAQIMSTLEWQEPDPI